MASGEGKLKITPHQPTMYKGFLGVQSLESKQPGAPSPDRCTRIEAAGGA